jgi:transposase InsO family protein
VKYATIDEHAGEVPVRTACELLGVRRQGYYEWRLRGKTQRQVRDEVLTVKIKNIFFESKRIYGARKIVRCLAREGEHVSRRRVRRLMSAAGLVPVSFRRHTNTTNSKHGMPIFPNLLNQNFKAEAVNRVWVSDMTYVATDEGWLYLCTVLDIYSRRVVGWAVSRTIDRHLAIAALQTAVKRRRPEKEWILHSDRGSQYASNDFRNAVEAAGGIQSMSRSGNPYDNACAESFFGSLKVEFLNSKHFASRSQAGHAIAEYMLWYNRSRIHASLDYLTPVEFELAMFSNALAS